MEKDTRYIYQVDYGKKSDTENYDVIKKLHYWRWDSENNKFDTYSWDTHNFAKGLIQKKYKAVACKDCGEKLKYCQDVIGYRQKDDGECWVKTSPNDTEADNLEFLNYCNKIDIVKRV